jgi:hypothetical protein
VASSIEYVGWGTGPWSRSAWGSSPVYVSVDGVSAGTALGEETIVADANVSPTGVSGAAVLGDISLVTNNYISVTGFAATSA